jgi:hypothetical protein
MASHHKENSPHRPALFFHKFFSGSQSVRGCRVKFLSTSGVRAGRQLDRRFFEEMLKSCVTQEMWREKLRD